MRFIEVMMMSGKGPYYGNKAPAIPTKINVEYIRCFYPRKPGNGEGTRITFINGTGFAVEESYATISKRVGGARSRKRSRRKAKAA